MTNSESATRSGLTISEVLDHFVTNEVLAPLDIAPEDFWAGVAEIFAKFGPQNAALLTQREVFQKQLDTWHAEHRGAGDKDDYRKFLAEIGYLEPEPKDIRIHVEGIDPEIGSIPGPQLVVPVNNARFALNAANARWGSLYDALYGTDMIGEADGLARSGAYNPVRGAKVMELASEFLDKAVPLATGSYGDAVSFEFDGVKSQDLLVRLANGTTTGLADATQFRGYDASDSATHYFLVHHGLHIELVVNRAHPIGKSHPAGLADVILESAVTTIQDCEDSVTAVDAADKVDVYRNWLGLMNGTLEATFEKEGKTFTRKLHGDRIISAPDGTPLTLPGRSVLLVRNVGIHMMTNAVRTADGNVVPEGLLDAILTVAIAMHDLREIGTLRNSKAKSIYVVKPKMHGSAEVAFTVEVFAAVERLLGLPENTVKIGIMDEERRTSLNLAACVAAARNRVIFINTGFLDRTGDEIHSAMAAGPVVRKGEMRSTRWLLTYEDHNVDVGIAAGFRGTAQIGKGMWAAPESMADMVKIKIAHPLSGASCAWVPSPTAATLHALHYHYVDVAEIQKGLETRTPAALDGLLELPMLDYELDAAAITEELENNAQGILGYVVRWIDQGVGCSKVPDVHGTPLMEDRATLRISSQHLANWLHHGIVDQDTVLATFVKMAEVVDRQNAGDPAYVPMMPNFNTNAAFSAAIDLVMSGVATANGYTEPVLNEWRLRVKSTAGAA